MFINASGEEGIRGAKLYRDDTVDIRGDRLYINSIMIDSFRISEKTLKLLSSLFDTPPVFKLNNDGYIVEVKCLKRLHVLIGDSRKDFDFSYWNNIGCPMMKTFDDNSLWNYMHLDNNKLNFNTYNIKRGPKLVNRSMHAFTVQRVRGKFKCEYTFDYKRYHTKCVDTEDEAILSRHCLQMAVMPDWMRTFQFEYLHNVALPKLYSETYSLRDEYKSIEHMIFLNDTRFKKETQDHSKFKYKSKNLYFFNYDYHTFSDSIKNIIHHSGVPFNDDKHCLLEYCGMNNNKLETLISKSCRSLFSDGRRLHLDKFSYVHYDKYLLSRYMLGLQRGNKLQACHGPGGPLDNRLECLRAGSCGSNRSDINLKTQLSTSKHRGVIKLKPTGKYRAQISISKNHISIGHFTNEADAASAYARVNEKRHELELLDSRALIKQGIDAILGKM